MAWLLLVVAGLFEVAWAAALPETEGFTRAGPTVVFAACLGASMYLLSLATAVIPLGTAYAVWVGIGAVGAAFVGIFGRGEPASLGRVVALAALIAALAAVKLTSQ